MANLEPELETSAGSPVGISGSGSSLTSSAPADVTKAAAAVGSAGTAARADHKHNISTAAAGALTLAGSSSEGTATSLARSDHNHALPATAAAGTIAVGDAAAAGTAVTLARSDHTHALTAPAAPANVTKAAAAAGSATTVARSDHKHDITTAATSTVGTANAEGSASSLARSDHNHLVSQIGAAGSGVTITGGQIWQRVTSTGSGGGYTVGAGDTVVEITGNTAAATVNLPGAATAGTIARVIDKDYHATTYPITVTPASGTVSGQSSWQLLFDGQVADFISDGTNWTVEPFGGADVIQDVAVLSGISLITEFRADTGTTIATGVSNWAPRNNAANYSEAVTQATGSKQPTVNSSWSRNGRKALTYTAASSQVLRSSAWTGGAVTLPVTWYVVAEHSGINTNQRSLVDSLASGSQNMIDIFFSNTSTNGARAYSGTGVQTSCNSLLGKCVVAAVFNGTQSRVYCNGSYVGGGNAGSNTGPTGVTIGNNWADSGTYWDGSIAHALMCNAAHNEWYIQQITRRLRAWYAI